jgi:hypothetical protein
MLDTILFSGGFAILNRWRGSDFKVGFLKLNHLAKLLICILLGSLIYCLAGGSWIIHTIVASILYLIGESFGWGKWVGGLLDRKPRYDEEEGCTIIFGYRIWDGIHHIANFICDERKHNIGYNTTALTIRGMYWWLPLLLYIGFVTTLMPTIIISSIVALSLWFPASVMQATFMPDSFPKIPYLITGDKDVKRWEIAEVIYGLMQGLVLSVMML